MMSRVGQQDCKIRRSHWTTTYNEIGNASFRSLGIFDFKNDEITDPLFTVNCQDKQQIPTSLATGIRPAGTWLLSKNNLPHPIFSANLSLVGGFKPFERYESNWIVSPSRGENRKHLESPPSSLPKSLQSYLVELLTRCFRSPKTDPQKVSLED